MTQPQPEPITVEVLKTLFQTHRIVRGIGNSNKMPSAEAMNRLAKTVDRLRTAMKNAPINKLDDEAGENLEKGLELILDSLPRIVGLWKWMSETEDSEQTTLEFRRLALLYILADEVAEWNKNGPRGLMEAKLPASPSERLAPKMPYLVGRTMWHSAAPILEDEFRMAMRSTNPSELGLSNDGPIIRFCAAVIPLITGEEPTSAAIARYLQRTNR